MLTQKEADEQSPEYIQLPLWSDILMAPEPDQPVELDEDSPKRPLVVTFYSFKGGVGRSTALGLVAGILATRNRRVVMVDFDLEAPGISVLFRSDTENFNREQYGVVDYLYQRYLNPEQNLPSIENCICQVNLPTRGELFWFQLENITKIIFIGWLSLIGELCNIFIKPQLILLAN